MARGKIQGQTKKKWSLVKRLHFGFRARMKTKGGKNVIKSRMRKGRSTMSVSEEFGPGTRKNKRFKRRR